ncbi:hypothetical protein CY34DRAFT_9038 [Suillus luteus UH-Slu-Lm8-n1]|uniref:Aminoglycoside phosphotransferase domain-containing protein n=1 Tax=Suillus luteus UH-Slu-Lm8-n1 TaxID=930992 RepID=A0A0D0BNC4_9AGAM|nr:hypothetical protein CY34DRAFT_9038 [Suillus luteus UH-Slu-Lm8-n1]
MSKDLELQISALPKSPWVNLSGLIDCATEHLSKPTCQSIQLLGKGSCNTVYKLVFADDTEIAASVSVRDVENFNMLAKLSEIATMQFVRASSSYPGIQVPEVHTCESTFYNPAGAPYVFMDVIHGRKLDDLINDDNKLRGLDGMSNVQQLATIKALAKLQSALSAPVPFDKIGSITRGGKGVSTLGPLFTITQQNLGGPYKSLLNFWRARLEHVIAQMHPSNFFRTILTSLLAHTPLRPSIILPPFGLTPSRPRTPQRLIDWGGAQILPLILTAKFPDDLNSTGEDPCERPGIPDEGWNTVPHDWTSFGDTSKWPNAFRGPNDQVDLTIRASAMIKRYYLRQHFGVCFAQENHDRYGDCDLGRAMLFAHAPYYLKFHEIVTGGWTALVDHAEWIRETYWRLHALKKDGRSAALIVGPNVYRSSVEKSVLDLNTFEKQVSEDEKEAEDIHE